MAALADNHPANSRAANGEQRRRPLLFRILGVLLASLMFSIFAEWVGIAFIWPESGVNHSVGMLEREVGYLNSDFRESAFGNDPALAITALAQRVTTTRSSGLALKMDCVGLASAWASTTTFWRSASLHSSLWCDSGY